MGETIVVIIIIMTCSYLYPPICTCICTELIASLFIRYTMRCGIWAQPAELSEGERGVREGGGQC